MRCEEWHRPPEAAFAAGAGVGVSQVGCTWVTGDVSCCSVVLLPQPLLVWPAPSSMAWPCWVSNQAIVAHVNHVLASAEAPETWRKRVCVWCDN